MSFRCLYILKGSRGGEMNSYEIMGLVHIGAMAVALIAAAV